MMSNNHKVVDIERLAHHEFDLDMEEQNRLQAEGDAEVARVRAVCKRGDTNKDRCCVQKGPTLTIGTVCTWRHYRDGWCVQMGT